MNIRALVESDLSQLRYIHDRYFSKDFTFEEFLSGSHCIAVVTDDFEDIITAGSVRPIAEAVVLTNKDYEIKERRKALYQLMNSLQFITRNAGYSHLHAFVHDDRWMRHLLGVGFNHTSGKSLIIGV